MKTQPLNFTWPFEISSLDDSGFKSMYRVGNRAQDYESSKPGLKSIFFYLKFGPTLELS